MVKNPFLITNANAKNSALIVQNKKPIRFRFNFIMQLIELT